MSGQHRRLPAEGRVEWTILDLLLQRTNPWEVGELVDEIGSPIAVAEALESLQIAGLIERNDTLICITPV